MFKIENDNGVLSVVDRKFYKTAEGKEYIEDNIFPIAGNIEGLKENDCIEADFSLKPVIEKDETGKKHAVIKVFIYSWKLIKEG